MMNGITETNQISFGGELGRKATHMCALVIPGGYYFLGLTKAEMLYIMVPVTLLMIVIDISRLREWRFWKHYLVKFFGRMVRHHEMQGDFTGATYILLSVCFTVALYSKPIAIAALSFIIVGDTFAALIGRKFGKHKFRSKSLEGSLGCLAGTIIVALLVPDLVLPVAVTGAFVATVTEALSFGIDDNVSVPIVSGLAMTLLHRFVTNW
jgi:dolichol kinase